MKSPLPSDQPLRLSAGDAKFPPTGNCPMVLTFNNASQKVDIQSIMLTNLPQHELKAA